jgi:pimeloyl-ACP methyl ester carboxylesterase
MPGDAIQVHRLEIPTPRGHSLAALLNLPARGRPVAYALFAHCFTCSKNFKAAYHISRALAREQLGVLRFDFTGLGESGGDFADTSLTTQEADLLAAADFLSARYESPKLLIGHSLGGTAVLLAAATIPAVRAVVTLAAPADPFHISRSLGAAAETIAARGEAEVQIDGRPFTLRRRFLDDLTRYNPETLLKTLDRALLIMHSPLDAVVGIENAARIFQLARHPKSFVSLDRADHLLSNADDARYAGAVIAAWARRYVVTPGASRSNPDPDPGPAA